MTAIPVAHPVRVAKRMHVCGNANACECECVCVCACACARCACVLRGTGRGVGTALPGHIKKEAGKESEWRVHAHIGVLGGEAAH